MCGARDSWRTSGCGTVSLGEQTGAGVCTGRVLRMSEPTRCIGAWDCPRTLEPTLSAVQMPREARSSPAGPITNACGVRRREDAGRRAPTIGEVSSRIAQRDFAKRFERGKLSFTGDVLQV